MASPMVSFSFRYEFSQRFPVPARDAYDWATDYRPTDWGLMGKKGRRKISHVTDDTLILLDTTFDKDGRPIVKKKLVKLDPMRLVLTNTHVDGPNTNSQFVYEFLPEGRGTSRLRFTGLQVNYADKPATEADKARLARKERDGDAEIWKNLAKAMEKDLVKQPPGSRPRKRSS